MADIGAAVGLLGGSLYYHVESKEALLYEIVETATRGLLSVVHEIAHMPKLASDRLRAAIVSHRRFSTDPERSDYVVVFLDQIARLGAPHMGRILNQLVRHYEQSFAAIVEDGIASGEFAGRFDPKTVVYAILGMENWALRWFRTGGRLSAEEVANEFAGLVIHGRLSRESRWPRGRG